MRVVAGKAFVAVLLAGAVAASLALPRLFESAQRPAGSALPQAGTAQARVVHAPSFLFRPLPPAAPHALPVGSSGAAIARLVTSPHVLAKRSLQRPEPQAPIHGPTPAPTPAPAEPPAGSAPEPTTPATPDEAAPAGVTVLAETAAPTAVTTPQPDLSTANGKGKGKGRDKAKPASAPAAGAAAAPAPPAPPAPTPAPDPQPPAPDAASGTGPGNGNANGQNGQNGEHGNGNAADGGKEHGKGR